MRDIKFRGKRADNGEWVYGYVIFTDDRAFIQHQNAKEIMALGGYPNGNKQMLQ